VRLEPYLDRSLHPARVDVVDDEPPVSVVGDDGAPTVPNDRDVVRLAGEVDALNDVHRSDPKEEDGAGAVTA
jgi:hypothetical protein